MWGANDPDCRKPMVWAEKKYDAEVFNPDQSNHGPDEVAFNKDLLDWYKKFIHLRKKYTSIKLGSYTTLAIDDVQKLYAFSRDYGKEKVIVVINRSNQPVTFTHALLKKHKYKNVFTKSVVRQMNVKPMDIVVLSN